MKKKEAEVIHTLGFRLEQGSVYETVNLLGELVDVGSHLKTGDKKYFQNVVNYLTKMVMHDYSLLTTVSREYLTSGVLQVALRIIEQLYSSFPTKIIVLPLSNSRPTASSPRLLRT